MDPTHKYFFLAWMLVSFLLYTGWIVAKFGVQPSISDSFYELQRKYGKGSLMPYTYWLFMVNVGWPIFPLLQFNVFSFFALVGLALAGAAAQFKDGRNIEVPHVLGASGGIVLAFIAIGAVFGGWAWGWLVGFLLILGAFELFSFRNNTWWTQVIAFVLIFTALIIYA